MQTKQIEAYGLLDYSLALEAAIKDGYSVDASTNEHCPTSYGGYLTATLIKSDGEKTEVQVATVSPAKPGRKAKDST